jgi:alpha-beta hydrolase superfamily lysophospholipase
MTTTTRYFFSLGGAVLTGAVGVAAYTSRYLNAPRRKPLPDVYTFSPWEVLIPYEAVSFTAEDGVVLRGWWFPREGSDRAVIGCSGHRRAKHDLLGIGSGLWRAGNSVLLFDFRNCGESDVAPASLAFREVGDARAAVRFVRERSPDARIGLIGYSMGGAVSLLAAAVDDDIAAVVADSAFATMHTVIAHAYRRRKLPGEVLARLTDHVTRWRYHYGFRDVRPLDVVGSIAPRPVLLIHGGRDPVVPVNEAFRLFAAANEPKELWMVPEARHCGVYFVDRHLYVEKVSGFFAEALATPAAKISQ